MNILEFEKQVQNHDWFHEMSDDHGVWKRGAADWDRLTRIANQFGDEYKKVINKEFARNYHREPFVQPYRFPYPDLS